MALWSRLTGRLRVRGVLAEDSDRDDAAEPRRPKVPPPTPTGRVPPRPPDTPGAQRLELPGATAGTRTYRSPGDTPSTKRIHNPRHFR